MSHGGHATAFASLPPSVAAYHLAWHPADGALYVTGPTISTRDRVYRIGRQGDIRTVYEGFGRPQGLAVDIDGSLLVAEALAGASGIYRLRPGAGRARAASISGPALVGIAVHPAGGYVVATAGRPVPLRLTARRDRVSQLAAEERRQRQAPHRVQAGRGREHARDRVDGDRRRGDVAVDAAGELHLERRRALDAAPRRTTRARPR